MQKKNGCERFLKSIDDTRWILEHFSSIKKRYKNEFIAVLNKKVVAHSKNIEELMSIVENDFPSDVEFITTEFISSKEIKVIL